MSQNEDGTFKGRDEQAGVARKMTLKGFILLKVTLALIWIKDGSAILGLVRQCAGGTVQGFRI